MTTLLCPGCGWSATEDGPAGECCPGCGTGLVAAVAVPEAGPAPANREVLSAGRGATPDPEASPPPESEEKEALFAWSSTAERPKGGFWLRAAAALVDMLIVSALQLMAGLLLGLVALAAGGTPETEVAGALRSLASLTLAITYYVFFIGYGGQTPGKMATGVRVVRTDGGEVGFGRAFLREVIGKFISGILLGAGFLMVAFDPQKQGLHDKLADTYVIKI